MAAAVLSICLFDGLGALGLVGPDEPRYAWVARSMHESGDWVTPRLYSSPWFEKPPLYYWGAASAFDMFGVSEAAARLPSAVAAMLAALAVAWAAWRYYGAATAWLVLLMFPTCVGVIGFARGASTDMVFSATMALAMVAAAEVFVPAAARQRSPWLSEILLGFFLGAATLAKGPAAVVLAGGSVLLWAGATRNWRVSLRGFRPRVVATFLLTAVPWYALCANRNLEFARVFLLEHNFQRFFTDAFRHPQPWWFFVPVLLMGLLPWTPLLVRVLRLSAQRAPDWRSWPGVFFLCWAVFPLVFFSISRSKLPGYVLPCAAPLVLVMAHSLVRSVGKGEALARWMLAGVGVVFAGLAAAAPTLLRRLPADAALDALPDLSLWLAMIAAGGVVVAALALTRRVWAAVVVSALLVAGVMASANRRLLPQLDPLVSSRATAELVADGGALAGEVQTYKLHRAWRFGLSFYLGRELSVWNAEQAGPVWLFTTEAARRELESQGRSVFTLPSVNGDVLLVRVE